MSNYRTRYARQEAVRRLAIDEPSLSTRAMAARLGLSKDTVRRDLAQLRRDGRLTQRNPDGRQTAEVARAITALVPGKPGARVVVSVTHHYTEPGRPSFATWTGTPDDLAGRILEAVTPTSGDAAQITAAVYAALAPFLTGGRG